ncbi:hypothetical protein EDC01DRAFT_679807 [Geopyxis carbonaria]|nr:hypothetical protein EDC01DRAFT_679807 [Geopyxis carbonaria]
MRPTTLDAFDVDLHTPRPRPRRSKRPRRSRGLEYARLVRGEKQKRRPSREPAVDWEPYWWEDRVGHNMMCSHCWCCVGIPYPWEELGWSWRDGWWNEDARADPDFFYRYYYCVHGVECWEDDDDGWSVIEGAEAGVLEPEEVEVPDGWRVVCRHRGARCVP